MMILVDWLFFTGLISITVFPLLLLIVSILGGVGVLVDAAIIAYKNKDKNSEL